MSLEDKKLDFMEIPELKFPETIVKDFYCGGDLKEIESEFNKKRQEVNESKNVAKMKELQEYIKDKNTKYPVEPNKKAMLSLFDGDENLLIERIVSETNENKDEVVTKAMNNLYNDMTKEEKLLFKVFEDELREQIEKQLKDPQVIIQEVRKKLSQDTGEIAGYKVSDRKRVLSKKGDRFTSVDNKFLNEYGEGLWKSVKDIFLAVEKNGNMIKAYEESLE